MDKSLQKLDVIEINIREYNEEDSDYFIDLDRLDKSIQYIGGFLVLNKFYLDTYHSYGKQFEDFLSLLQKQIIIKEIVLWVF